MNFYKHYIGDFQRDTGHLSLTERGAYLALIHHYYATETPLPTEHAALCRIAGAFTKAERDAVKRVAGFFEVREGQLWHKRIEAELEKQADRCDKNRAIALNREARKRAAEHSRAGNGPTTKTPPEDHVSCNESSTNRDPNVASSSHENSTIPYPQPEPVSIGIPTLVAKDRDSLSPPAREEGEKPIGTPAGHACKLLKAEGITDCNPGHPTLIALLDAGVTADELIGAAQTARKASAGFAYVLKVVANNRKRAKDLAGQIHAGPLPQQPRTSGQPGRYAGAAAAVFDGATHV